MGNLQQHNDQSKKYTLCIQALGVYETALVTCLGSDQTPDPQNIDFLSSFSKSWLFFKSYHLFLIPEPQGVISTEQNQYQ